MHFTHSTLGSEGQKLLNVLREGLKVAIRASSISSLVQRGARSLALTLPCPAPPKPLPKSLTHHCNRVNHQTRALAKDLKQST